MNELVACMIQACGPNRMDARRQKVMDISRRLFAQRGFHATGIALIAKESGVAVAQIYRDFASKEEIVAQIIEHDCGAMLDNAGLTDAIAARDGEAILAWIDAVMDPANDGEFEKNILFEIIAESSRNQRMAAIFQKTHDQLRDKLLAALNLLVPGTEKAQARSLLTEKILTLGIGLRHRPLIDTEGLQTELVVSWQQSIRQEIRHLAQSEFNDASGG